MMDYRSKRLRSPCPQQEQDDYMIEDTRSIDTAMGVRDSSYVGPPYNMFPLHDEAVRTSFELPRGLQGSRRMLDEDDISVLTEFSGMEEEEEEDASSQVTVSVTSELWTVVTTATGSTTIPTRNINPELSSQRGAKRRYNIVAENPFAHDNTHFKRCRKR